MTDYKKLCEDLRLWEENYIGVKCGEGWMSCDEYCESDDCIIVRACKAIEELQAENEWLKKQLDAAVEDLRKLTHEHCTCYACINDKFDYQKKTCTGCQHNGWNNWQWRGEEGKA